MVDIHSHILPGIDDGAPSLDVSLDMLRIAERSGTTDIVATPHASPRYPFHPETVAAALAQLRAANPTSVRIHHGSDFHLDFDLIQDALAHPTRYTINNGRFLLIELSDGAPLTTVRPTLQAFVPRRVTPILTHPERYLSLRNQVTMVGEWRQLGCLVQITAGALTGAFGSSARKFAEQLLRNQWVDFVASDSHDTAGRSPDMAAAFEATVRLQGADTAERVFRQNPSKVLDP